MKLRINPWFTDACTVFLNNLFKWYPKMLKERFTVLEWGGGNSTLYFLQKGARLLTVENNPSYVSKLQEFASILGYSVNVAVDLESAMKGFFQHDLSILQASNYNEVGERVFAELKWTLVVNDGMARKEVLDVLMKLNSQSIVVLDNVEYCANWGHLERSSAHPDRAAGYRRILRDPAWRVYLFEQLEGRNGHAAPDYSGWEAPHRWISGVLWRSEHILTRLMVSNIGLPVVTIEGADDEDLTSLSERCPFDRKENKWLVERYDRVFDLERDYE